jgi:hypothetical protein
MFCFFDFLLLVVTGGGAGRRIKGLWFLSSSPSSLSDSDSNFSYLFPLYTSLLSLLGESDLVGEVSLSFLFDLSGEIDLGEGGFWLWELNLGGSLRVKGIGITYWLRSGEVLTCKRLKAGEFDNSFNCFGDNDEFDPEVIDLISSSLANGSEGSFMSKKFGGKERRFLIGELERALLSGVTTGLESKLISSTDIFAFKGTSIIIFHRLTGSISHFLVFLSFCFGLG